MEQQPTAGEPLAVNEAQAAAGPGKPVDGIDERTSHLNPDSAADTLHGTGDPGLGGSEQGGMAGPVGTFEGEGNEGPFAPLGGDPAKPADRDPSQQGGTASGAPDTA